MWFTLQLTWYFHVINNILVCMVIFKLIILNLLISHKSKQMEHLTKIHLRTQIPASACNFVSIFAPSCLSDCLSCFTFLCHYFVTRYSFLSSIFPVMCAQCTKCWKFFELLYSYFYYSQYVNQSSLPLLP